MIITCFICLENYVFLLVVEDDVWSPYLRDRDANVIDVAKILWIPFQQNVSPCLHDRHTSKPYYRNVTIAVGPYRIFGNFMGAMF